MEITPGASGLKLIGGMFGYVLVESAGNGLSAVPETIAQARCAIGRGPTK